MRVNSQQNTKNIPFVLRNLLWVFFLIFFTENFAQNKTFTVVLDPGHGGKDSGTTGIKDSKKIYEKDIVLSVALKIGEQLEQEHPDIKVIYTRKTDVFVELHKRGEIANKADADLFVSIHVNAASPSAYGTETYVLGVHRNASNLEVAKKENDVILLEENYEKHYSYDPNNPESLIGLTLMQEDYLDQSIRMAKITENVFARTNRKSKGVKQAGFVVLHQSYMPSILTEIGFLSHTDESEYLRSDRGQLSVAKALTEAIAQYKSEIDQNSISETYDKNNVVEDTIHQENRIFEGITFKIQLATSSNNLSTVPSNFKGLEGVEKVASGKVYKYFVGNTSDYDEILKIKEKAVQKGYKDCFIIALKGQERVPVNEVVKTN